MGTVREIHPRLIRRYEKDYRASAEDARGKYATSTLAQLQQARSELEQHPGTLSISQRAWMRGQLGVIDSLIEQAVLSSSTATR
jgi:hypothetical protein